VDYGRKKNKWFSNVLSSKVNAFPGKVDLATNAFYRGPSQNAQTDSKGIFSLIFGILVKNVFKDKAQSPLM